ncbi:hypothetical protein [Dokdonella soli]|uniref:Dicarboxylate transport domain-containing protein n=1 Tax=Dokdonella soli TaxID=529810 RepID=A0ABN1IDP9_9GAMM
MLVAAGVLALHGVAAQARTLMLTAERLSSPQAHARSLHVAIDERADTASLRLGADRIDIPLLALAGRLDWGCPLRRDDDGALTCSGPVAFAADGSAAQAADFAVRVASDRIELALARDGSRVALTIPLAAGEPKASLQEVPAAWLKAPLAQAWHGGELRDGIFDAEMSAHANGRIEATYRATQLAFNTLDGTVSGDGVAVAGRVEWTDDEFWQLLVDANFGGGALHIGALHVALPNTPVALNLDMGAGDDNRWHVERFAWRDPEALMLEASGEIEPSALAPLRKLALRVERAHFPLANERYAKTLLAAQGLGKLMLTGDLVGEFVFDGNAPQQVALSTDALDIDDGAGHAVRGIRGGFDWSLAGERPATTLAWRSARIGDLAVPASTSRWQSRNGSLLLLGALETRLFGGKLKLQDLMLHPASGEGERVSTAFALNGVGYDSKDGSLAAAHLAAEGRLRIDGNADAPRVQIDAEFHGGEALAGPVYVKLPDTPVKATLDATRDNARWRIDAFDWNDPGTLDLHMNGEISPAQTQPIKALVLDVRNATLGPALDRYARSWLASKGYGELTAGGALSGSLQFDAGGVQRFAFNADRMNLRDGAGRFAFAGVDGGVDWDFRADRPPTTLGWSSIELFKIPLGATSAKLESRQTAITLAQPLAIDVLGGQVRLEKLSLQPRSPRGERYAGSFAIAGIEMAQLSAALGWPRFGGNLSGGIPEIEFAGDTIELHGGLDLYVFDGHLGVSGLTLERPFGIAPSMGADIHFENLDLDQVTSAFSFGGMSGRLAGTIGKLRLVDWSPVAFDAWLRTSGGGRMSYKAVDDITSIGGGGGLSASLQTMALKIFDTFGYRRLGIRCRLRDEVCTMGGIDPIPADAGATGSANDGYTIVEGSGLPRIMIVGHRRRVDWPTLVRRLQEATHGQAPIVN